MPAHVNAHASTTAITPNRTLLNPRFENYKLKLSGGVASLQHFPLAEPVKLDKVPSASFLPYRKLEARSSFNHLFPAPAGGTFFIDGKYNLVYFGFDKDEKHIFKTIHSVPVPQCEPDEREYPSLICTGSFLLLSNGGGLTQLLQFDDKEKTAHVVGLVAGLTGKADTHIVLTACRHMEDTNRLLCLAYSMPEVSASEAAPRKPMLTFDLNLWSINLPTSPGQQLLSAERVSGLSGYSVPLFAAIESNGAYIIGSSNPYESISPAAPGPTVNSPPPAQPAPTNNPTEQPIEYMWTQTPTDITISIRLPHITLKRDVHVHFSPTTLHAKIQPPKESELFSPDRPLFDSIVPKESIWTLENNRTLTLYIQKANAKTRWAGLWNDMREGDVEETVDPSEMAQFLESMEKYTGAEGEVVEEGGEGAKGPLVQTVTERSEAVDFEGWSATFVRADVGGNVTHMCYGPGHEWLGFVLGEREADTDGFGAVCLKSDVDGLVYSVKAGLELKHIASFDAFGFVQASKRDKKFVAVTPGPEYRYAVVVESVKHVYLYQRGKKGEIYAEQFVVDLTEEEAEEGGTPGQVIGVQMIDEKRLAILKEEQIVVIELHL